MNAMLEKTLPAPERLDVQSGNVRLAVWRWGEAHLPMVLFVHGYPDNHETWLPLIRHLSGRFQLVAYDVRGAGESDKPRKTRDYRLELLSQDLKAVLDAVSPQRAVHLVAHDWGSIQTWESVTDPQLRARIASYTSVSGPCLDHVGFWMRDRLRRKTPRALLQMASQLLHSWYIYYFHLPLLPSLSWRFGAAKAWPQYLRKVEGIRNPVRNPHQASDGEHGVKLYRANFITSIFKPRKRHTEVPVQLIVPTRDRYVGQQLFQQLSLWAPRLWRRDVTAGHWQLLAEPARLGKWIDEFVSHIEGGEAPPELQRAALKPGAGPFAGKLVVVTGAGGGIG
ncbi:alpha/beta fold hydrolase, partial [Pseudomonas nitroreducens]|uniref:alpha/beta fold hydrolase n=2 Tax=Pseudomonas TaxID=286 RepID=UPI0028AB0A4F